MPQVHTYNELNIHRFPTVEAYRMALEKGVLKEGDLVSVDGDEYVVDDKVTPNSRNLITSGAVNKSVEEAKKEVAPTALTNFEIEELLNSFV